MARAVYVPGNVDYTNCMYCVPLRATLRVETCARRHTLSNEGIMPLNSGEAMQDLRDSVCKSCPTGAVTSELVQPIIRRGVGVSPKIFSMRACAACGRAYRPTGQRQRYCGCTTQKTGAASKKSAPEVANPPRAGGTSPKKEGASSSRK